MQRSDLVEHDSGTVENALVENALELTVKGGRVGLLPEAPHAQACPAALGHRAWNVPSSRYQHPVRLETVQISIHASWPANVNGLELAGLRRYHSSAAETVARVWAAPLLQVAVDLFVMGSSNSSVDAATLREVTGNTGGQLYHYQDWAPALDGDLLFNDLRWNLQRPQVPSPPPFARTHARTHARAGVARGK